MRQGKLLLDGASGSSKCRDAGSHIEWYAEQRETPRLLRHGAPQGEVAGMDSRNIETVSVGASYDGNNLVDIHLGRINQSGSRPGVGKHLLRNKRARIKTNWRGMDQVSAAKGEKVGRTRACTDEMNGHGSTATAQVQSWPTRRGTSRRAETPSDARAEASATLALPTD
jgi:hypothetical protein